jgi:hypothetical protein
MPREDVQLLYTWSPCSGRGETDVSVGREQQLASHGVAFRDTATLRSSPYGRNDHSRVSYGESFDRVA